MTFTTKSEPINNLETLLILWWVHHCDKTKTYWLNQTKQLLETNGGSVDEILAGLLEKWVRSREHAVREENNRILPDDLSKVDWSAVARLCISHAADSTAWPVIHSYSRADAISDGALIDVSDLAKEAGFRYPVAMTAAAWGATVEVPSSVADFQDEKGRLWDVLSVLRIMAKSSAGSEVLFTVSVVVDEERSKDIELKSLCGPGDTPAPVITVMLPHED